MKKINLRPLLSLLAVLVVVAAGLLFSACDEIECIHLRTDETTVPPDCSKQGYVLHECRDCGYTYKSDFKEPYGHKISTDTHEPTCTEQGYTAYWCAMCDYAYSTDYIAPLGHEIVTETSAPTCEKSGYTAYTCSRECGYTYTSDFVAPLGHDLVSAHFLATCTEGGYTRYICSACGLDYRSAVSAPKGHSFTDTVVRPSFARTGYTTHTCFCGYSYTDSYVWYSDVFSGAAANSDTVFSHGIDISYYQKNVNWKTLKSVGIDYVILRAAYYPKDSEVPAVDPLFEQYYEQAKAAGLDVGCYIYSMAYDVETALDEAEFMINLLDGKKMEYPVYFDLEDPSLEWLDTDTQMDMALAFCQELTDNGYFPGVYTNNDWLVNQWNAEQLTTLYDVWFARYPFIDSVYYETWSYVPDYAGDYGMWQYTEKGQISGVTGAVDLNFCYKDYPSIIKKYGYNGY